MKILFCSELFWPYIGGVERLGARLITDLGKREHDFTIITSHGELDLPDHEYFAGVPLHRYPFRRSLSDGDPATVMRVRRDVEKTIQSFAPDLIHLYSIGSVLFFLKQLLRKREIPMVVTLHNQLTPSQSRYHNTVLTETLSMASWVASCSESALTEARELVPAIRARSSVIRNAFDFGTFAPEPVPSRPMNLLCLGRLVPQKGFDAAISTVCAVRERFPDVRLQIVGEGPERPRLEQQVRSSGLRDIVSFPGQVSPDHVPGIIDRAGIVLMPSLFEGLPVVAIEAALVGRPLIATRVGGISEIVRHGKTGLLTEPGDLQEFIDATTSLLEAPELAARMGAAARRRARSQFSWSAHREAYSQLYERMLNQRNPRRGPGGA